MSFVLKLLSIILFINFSRSFVLLNKTRYSNDFFFDKESAIVESQIYFILHQISPNSDISNFLFKILYYMLYFFDKTKMIKSWDLFTRKSFLKCGNHIFQEYMNKSYTEFYTYIESSGKGMNDFGNEHYCITGTYNENKTNYYLLYAYLENADQMTNYEDKILINFLDQRCFYLGVCIPKQCGEFLYEFLEEKQILDFMYTYLSLNNFSLNIIPNYEDNDDYKDKDKEQRILGDFINYSFYALILFKLFFSFIRSFSIFKDYEANYLNNENNDNLNNKAPIDTYFQFIYGKSVKEEDNLYNPFHDYEKNYPFHLRLIKSLDLIDNIKLIFTISNKYYNSCCIKKINFLKIIALIMSISLKLMISQVEIPSKSFLVNNFYTYGLFFIIKICIFSSVFWIILDAMTAGFKLMSFLKKKIRISKDNELSFGSFAQFCLLLIPKIFLFIICFFVFHIYSNKIIYSLTDQYHRGPFMVYNYTNYDSQYSLRNNGSFGHMLKSIVPIYINYIDYFIEDDPNSNKTIKYYGNGALNPSNATNHTFYNYYLFRYKIPSPFLTNTELFINIYLNEFVLFFLMLIVAYISYRIKSKVFDYSILIINLILYIIPALNLTKYIIDKEEKYTLLYILGQNFSEKYTHYFINFYYFGFMIGVMLFYHNEFNYKKIYKRNTSSINIINSYSSHNSNEDTVSSFEDNSNISSLPFSFCNDWIIILDNCHRRIKCVVFFVSLGFIILISSSFNLIQRFYNLNENEQKEYQEKGIDDDLIIKVPNIGENSLIRFIFLYEKNLCGIFFFICLMMFIVLPSESFINKFCNLNCFTFFDRISFSSFCTFNFFVYAAFCVFYLDFKLMITSIILNSIGIFLLLLIINIAIVCIFELPIRMIIKSYMNKNLINEFKTNSNFNSAGLYSQSRQSTINYK